MEKPILFNTEMVKAILDGRKTVTRRLVKPRYRDGDAGFRINRCIATGQIESVEIYDEDECGTGRYVKPPYNIGDVLYVRETWNISCANCECDCPAICNTPRFRYRADYETTEDKWKPSIHMPKEAARIWLRVTNVRVERLQDMSVDDAAREGSVPLYVFEDDTKPTLGALDEFRRIWDSTISDTDIDQYGWTANPWVWVIKFERMEVEKC